MLSRPSHPATRPGAAPGADESSRRRRQSVTNGAEDANSAEIHASRPKGPRHTLNPASGKQPHEVPRRPSPFHHAPSARCASAITYLARPLSLASGLLAWCSRGENTRCSHSCSHKVITIKFKRSQKPWTYSSLKGVRHIISHTLYPLYSLSFSASVCTRYTCSCAADADAVHFLAKSISLESI